MAINYRRGHFTKGPMIEGRDLFRNSPNPMWVFGIESGKILQANKAAEQFYGYSREEFRGMNLRKLHREEEVPKLMEAVQNDHQLLGNNGIWTHRKKEGTNVKVRLASQPVEFEGAEAGLMTIHDLTEWVDNARVAAQQPDYGEDFIETLPGIYYLLTAGGKYLEWNKELEKVSGYSAQEISRMSPLDFFLPEHHEVVTGKIEEVMEGGKSEMKLPLITRDGRKIPYHFMGLATEVDGIPCIRGLAMDISEVYEVRSESEKLNRKLAAIVESSGDAIIGKDLDGTITSWNKGAEQMYGYSAGEAVGENIRLIVPESKRDELDNVMEKLRRGEQVRQFETLRISKGGKKIHVSLTISSIVDQGGSIVGISAIGRDITEQKRKEEMNRFLLQASQILAKSIDYDKTLSNVAELAVKSIADWCSIELLGEDGLERVTVQHADPEKREYALKLQERYPRRKRSNESMIEKVVKQKKSVVIEQISDDMLREQTVDREHYKLLKELGLESAIIAPMLVGNKVNGVITLISDSPGRHYTEHDKLFAAELARHAALAIEDARLYRESRKLNEELELRVQERTRQLKKANEELESFSYSVSHDLRAPLRAIAGYTNMLMTDHAHKLDDEGKRFLTILQEESTRMGELIDDLLAFSRMSRKEKQYAGYGMNEIIEEALKEIEMTYHGGDYQLDVGEMPEAVMDPRLMKQVWINLIGNAITYRKPEQQANIRIRAEETDGGVRFTISDDGIGFDEKYADKIFGVFERLHHASEIKGTGIGLALVKRIIQRHNGEIAVESEPDVGTTFYFTLPKTLEQ